MYYWNSVEIALNQTTQTSLSVLLPCFSNMNETLTKRWMHHASLLLGVACTSKLPYMLSLGISR